MAHTFNLSAVAGPETLTGPRPQHIVDSMREAPLVHKSQQMTKQNEDLTDQSIVLGNSKWNNLAFWVLYFHLGRTVSVN